jgi:hypothetical protein
MPEPRLQEHHAGSAACQAGQVAGDLTCWH